MRRDYKALLLAILTFACILTSGLLLFGTIDDATQVNLPACEQQFKRECLSRKEALKPGLICPSPRQPCPLDETETGQQSNKGEHSCINALQQD
ncbi:hypothetical protein C6496_13965 [Candidatus Poribacteria bacterium]|nr:MAG: hypothetical protein C6496_13965 [Candidatus Poribacteria bacterium]